MKYCKHRYAKRQFRWKAADPHEDESIQEGLRSLDLMCFSSQYYFVLSFSSVALFILTISAQTLLRQQDRHKGSEPYNPFGDKMLPFVVIIVFMFCKLIHWFSIYLGYRILWRHKTSLTELDEAGMLLDPDGKKDLNLPDWASQGFGGGKGGQGGGEDTTTDSFRHRFFNANKPWIIQQLGLSMSPRTQLNELGRGEPLHDDKRGDISSDEGSSSDSDREGFELDPMAKAVARRWLSKTRRRLGLPDKTAQLDISSDDETTDSDDDGPPAHLSSSTEEIARKWLSKVRAHIPQIAGQPEEAPEARADISSDEESDSAQEDRPVVAMSAPTRNIAKLWLKMVRGDEGAPQRRVEDISDDESSESDGSGGAPGELGPKARAIAKQWLSQVRQPGRRPAAADISGDDSSDSGSERSDRADPPPDLSAKAKAIALAWLRNIRR